MRLLYGVHIPFVLLFLVFVLAMICFTSSEKKDKAS